MTENQQEHVYQEFIRFREAFIAAHQLLQSDMVSEARAVIAARLDKSLLGESDPIGGHIGEFLISRYKPNAWEGTPENIQIMPRLNALPQPPAEQVECSLIDGVTINGTEVASTTQTITSEKLEPASTVPSEAKISEEDFMKICWADFLRRVKKKSTPTALLLSRQVCILEYKFNSHVYFLMSKRVINQLRRQKDKANIILDVSRELFGDIKELKFLIDENNVAFREPALV
jgi:hypothetical protein